MPEKSVAEKLMIQSESKVYLINPPRGYKSMLGKIPAGVQFYNKPAESLDLIQLFATCKADLQSELAKIKSLLKPDGLLWVTYPKESSGMKADINRDSINAYAQSVGLTGVAMISIDDTWSALRLKTLK